MYRLRYRIRNLSPLLIASKLGDMNMVSTEKHIPGTSVLGVLADRFIRKRHISEDAHMKSDFFNCFLSGNLRISNAYIVSKDEDVTYYPIPFSVREEKQGDAIFDLLFADDDFDKQTRSLNKFCMFEDEYLQTNEVETSLNFHHARDPRTGTSEKGLIFNYESIAPDQIFRGEISGNEADLLALLDACGKTWTAYTGRSKNAQYGKIEFGFINDQPVPCGEPEIDWDDKISLTFLSNTILYNENGFSTVDTGVLAEYLGVTIEKAFIRKGEVENFVGIWQLKKPSETCFLAGSTFLLDISESDLGKLLEFQKNGIGERTHEGFGRCIFDWQQGYERLTEPTKPDASFKLRKPGPPVPDKAREVLKTLAANFIREQIRLLALKELNAFDKDRLPSNALIGRLGTMIRDKSPKNFTSDLKEKLKKSARAKLERCNNGEQTLFEFLTDDREFFNKIRENKSLTKLCKDIDYPFEDDDDLRKELWQTYFSVFFSSIRKCERPEKKDG